MINHVESHYNETVLPSVLEQYKSSENWKGILASVVGKYQVVEDDACELAEILDTSTEVPTGHKLDFICGLVNIKRKSGESDQILWSRFEEQKNHKEAGTPDYVIRKAVAVSGDDSPIYHEEVPAVFFVYTPNGSQLLRSQVKKLSPAGVLGLPGSALKFVDKDSPILTKEHKRILTVARDATRGT